MATDVPEVVENPEFDPERVLLREEFVIDSEGVLTHATYFAGDRFKFWEMVLHLGVALLFSSLFLMLLEEIKGFQKVEVIRDGQCESLLGWKCPRSVLSCAGLKSMWLVLTVQEIGL
jgi:hypothetical protein